MTENPLHDGLRLEPTPGPTTLVIFGASGDLTKRKLLPALYHLSQRGRLPAQFAVIGIARSPMDDEGFRKQFRDSLQEFGGADVQWDENAQSLASRLFYSYGELDDPEFYKRLAARLTEIDGGEGVLFYLAIPPGVYGPVIENLGTSGLASAPLGGWRRIVVEKPFGTDLASARELNQIAHKHFSEEQVYRIDHYLGKETVQNLLVFRFANGMFEPVWNRRYIDHVQITAAETVGVEHRAAYYETAGAVRDMVQNHLMQLLALVAMEPPIAFSAESVRMGSAGCRPRAIRSRLGEWC
jgi:glucose-6-phosphate 1-dehydrogenase